MNGTDIPEKEKEVKRERGREKRKGRKKKLFRIT